MAAPSGCALATYSSPPMTMRVVPGSSINGARAGARVGSQRGCADHAVHRERDVGARQRLELGRAPIVEQGPDGQDAEHLGPLEAQRDRHAHHFEHAPRM